jgi:predicted TIM-barrel fold metal-dependent hydrolase
MGNQTSRTQRITPPSADRDEPFRGRRQLLARGAMLFGSTLVGSSSRAAAAESAASGDLTQNCIDAHSHVWTSDVKRYPLAAPFTPADMQPPSFTPDELMAQARPAGVNRVVLIQMSYYGFDNRYTLDAIRDKPGTFSAVAVVDESAPRLRETMLELKQQGVRGFRIHAGSKPVEGWLFNPQMAAMWKHGADADLAMCALVNPEALEPLERMCHRFPKTTLVVDHFARIGMDGTVREADVEALCRLARHERTYVKVSAFYALGQKKSPYTDLAPMIKRLVKVFGPERLMWATDCPYQVQNEHTYLDSIELIRSRLDFLSVQERTWLLRKTAEKVFFS